MIKSTLLLLGVFIISTISYSQDAYHYYNKGVGQMAYENYLEAIQDFSKAVELKNDYANAFANRGLCYHRLKQYDLAIADYLKTESLVSGQGSYNLACAYSLVSKPEEAFKWLTLCQKSDYKQIRTTLEGDTDFENIHSDKRWKTIVETDWHSPYERTMLDVDIKYNASDVAGAIVLCTKAITLEHTKTRPYFARAYMYSSNQEWVKAADDCDKAILLKSKEWDGYANKATLLYKQKKYADALILYQQAIDLNAEYAPYFDMAMSKFAIAKHKEALKDLKTYLEFYPKDDFAVYFAGYIHYTLLEDAAAFEYANKAIDMNPAVAEYHLLKANIYLATKDFNKAIEGYTKVLAMNEKSGEAYYKRAIALAERFAKNGDKQDKKDFCADMEKAEELNYEGAAQYLRELCN